LVARARKGLTTDFTRNAPDLPTVQEVPLAEPDTPPPVPSTMENPSPRPHSRQNSPQIIPTLLVNSNLDNIKDAPRTRTRGAQ